jgi:hypothetical protein
MQIVATITVYINEKLLRKNPLKYVGPRIRLLALQKSVGTPRKIQQLCLAQSQTHHWKTF